MLISFWMLVAMIIATSTQILEANNKTLIKVIPERLPAICGSIENREFIVKVDMGEVLLSDSLYGYNFQLRYDSTKIKITDYLVLGTLAENCSYKACAFNRDTIRGYASNMDMVRLYGKKPLFALKGHILTKCEDSALIKIDFVEFTSEYIKDSVEYQDLMMPIGKISNPNNSISIVVPDDTLYLEKSIQQKKFTYSIDVSSSYPASKINAVISGKNADRILYVSEYENSEYTVSSVKEKDKINIELKYKIPVNYKSTKIDIQVNTNEIDNIKDFSESYKFEIMEDKCSCIDNYKADSIRIMYKESSVSEWNIDKTNNIDKIETVYTHDNINFEKYIGYNNIKIIDCFGKLIIEKDIDNHKTINLNEHLTNGVYFGILSGINNKIIKIIKYSFIN